MTGFYFRGGDGKLEGVGRDPQALGCVLAVVNAGGGKYCFGTVDVNVPEIAGGNLFKFVGAIRNDPMHREEIDPFQRTAHTPKMTFEVLEQHFPFRDLRRAGVLLQDVDVDVYWYIANRGMDLRQSLHLIKGKMTDLTYNEENGVVVFSVEDRRLEGEKPFPPVMASTDLISTLEPEDSGKPYPIVVGSVNKLPLLDIDATNHDDFLVMMDPAGEWSSPAQVSKAYDGDVPLVGPLNENQATDADGNVYVSVTDAGGGPATRSDVTADVTGHTPSDPAEAIRYLLTFLGDDDVKTMFDQASLNHVERAFRGVSLALAFNARGSGGVVDAIRDRLCSLLPIAIVQRGKKYSFDPLLWDRNVTAHLKTDVNVIRKLSGPTETRRNEVYNSFTVKYGRSGLRGDHTGCITKDWATDNECERSRRRYGKRAMPDIDAGDLEDEDSARWLMDWLIETYSKMRVFVSYRCTLDAVKIKLWDTVVVEDDYEGWVGQYRLLPMFKVIGIRRGTGPWIDLDLVSVDDYSEVYQVNRPVISEVLTPAAGGPFGGHPTLGNDLVLYYAMHDNLSFPDPDRFVVVDSHTNGYDGESQTETGGMNDPGGIIGDCFNFNASLNDDVEIPDIRSHFTDEATLAIWLNLNNAPPLAATHTGLCRFSTSAYPSVTAYPFTDNNFYCAIFRNARLAGFSIAGGVDESTWHLLIVSTKPGANNYNIYQNLTNILSTTGLSQVYLEAACYLGRSNDPGAGSANFFDGLMGPAMVWSRELTAGERVDLYNGGAGLAY